MKFYVAPRWGARGHAGRRGLSLAYWPDALTLVSHLTAWTDRLRIHTPALHSGHEDADCRDEYERRRALFSGTGRESRLPAGSGCG